MSKPKSLSPKKARASANDAESVMRTTNEKILQECYSLYVDEEKGLIKLGRDVGVTLLPPRRKVIVMVMGNHSAGKSSFINWYVEEQVQRTGVALETQGISFITTGKKRDSLTGNATLHLYPHFNELQHIKGVTAYLGTEVITSREKQFGLVTFVDTPGLVDGDMKYPFDVEQTLIWLGGLADLTLVFFDPMGQALCKRTLDIVEQISEQHPDRLKFYLAKADTAGTETDRQRVLMQITQELCKRPGLNQAGFDMPTVYIPSLIEKTPKCENQLGRLEKQIEKTISQMMQSTLNSLERDSEKVATSIDQMLESDRQQRSRNCRGCLRGLFLGCLGLVLPCLLLLHILTSQTVMASLSLAVGEEVTSLIHDFIIQFGQIWSHLPFKDSIFNLALAALISLVLLTLSRWSLTSKPTLPSKSRKRFAKRRQFLREHVKEKKEQLYKEYLFQSVGEPFPSEGHMHS